MKILVLSDIHGNKKRFKSLLETPHIASCDVKVSLGDQEINNKLLNQYDINAVKGNAPFDSGEGHTKILDVAGWRLMIAHGHKMRVERDYKTIHYRMEEEHVDIAMHGHTHRMAYSENDGKVIINPGAVNQSRDLNPESYMILELNDKTAVFRWFDVYDHEELARRVFQK